MAGKGEGRLDRMERMMEGLITSPSHLLQAQENLVAEHQRLLTAQVILTETVQKLAEQMRTGFAELRASLAELRTSQALTDERLRALIDTLRNPPKN